jgi:dihydrofolate reductase
MLKENPKISQPKISIIAAISRKNRGIGMLDGKLPWHIPEDFNFFKETTIGHPIIMGRKTFETFKKLLPGRTHIVISRQSAPMKFSTPDFNASDFSMSDFSKSGISQSKTSNDENLFFVKSLEEALDKARQIEQEEIFIIGGGQIYELGLPYADKLYLTFIDGDLDAQVFFPDFKTAGFTEIISSRKSNDENFEYEFVTLVKK